MTSVTEPTGRLRTVDLLTRRLYGRSIDEAEAVRELRTRGWPPRLERAFLAALLPLIGVERYLAWFELELWDLPTGWPVVVRSAAISLLLSSPLVAVLTALLASAFGWGWHLLAGLLAWPAAGLALWTVVPRPRSAAPPPAAAEDEAARDRNARTGE